MLYKLVPLSLVAAATAIPTALMPEGDGLGDRSMHEAGLGCARDISEMLIPDDEHNDSRVSAQQQMMSRYKPHVDEELAEHHFTVFDQNGDGQIVLGEALHHGDIDQWTHSLEKYDENNDAKMSFREFTNLIADRREHVKDEDNLVRTAAYESFDGRPPGSNREDYELHLHKQSEPEFVYETAAFQKLLASRQQEIRVAEKSLMVGSMSLSARHDAVVQMFKTADANADGVLTLDEYTSSGDESRYEAVQGGYKQAIDKDGDGRVSAQEALNAAAFEYDVLDQDRDGKLTSAELVQTLENKGWLRKKDWHVAHTLSEQSLSMPHHMTVHVETHYGDTPDEDYGDEEACEAAKVVSQTNAVLARAAATIHYDDDNDDATPPKLLSESATLDDDDVSYADDVDGTEAAVRAMSSVTRKLSKDKKKQIMTNALDTAYATVTNILSTDFCWRKTYDRGVGKIAGCGGSHPDARAAMCYATCPAGSARHWHDVEYCGFNCPSGSTDIGLHCRTNGHTKSKSCCGTCWPRSWCCRTWCCGGCGSGWTNTGCFCEPSWVAQRRDYSPGKTKYSVGQCHDPSYPDRKMTPLGYFCYPAPKVGYQCQMTTCQSSCLAHMTSCGPGACALSAEQCAASIGQMVLDTSLAVVSTALTVATFGTAGAGGTQGLRFGVASGTRALFKSAAKASLRGFQKQIAKSATKNAIKNAVFKKIKQTASDLAESVALGFAAQATQAVVEAIQSKTPSQMEEFDYTAFDPTGIASATESSLDGDSDIDQAAAWTGAVGTFDPTGWVAAAASFMKGSCDMQTADVQAVSPFIGLSGVKVGRQQIQLGNSWRMAVMNSAHFSIGHKNGNTMMIFRSDATLHPNHPPNGWNPFFSHRGLGAPEGVTVGNKAIQFGCCWRLAEMGDSDHLSMGHSSGYTPQIWRYDGTRHPGHGPDVWSPWAANAFRPGGRTADLGEPDGVYSRATYIQIGNFRLGVNDGVDGAHFSIGYKGPKGKKTIQIYRLDRTHHPGPRDDWNPWDITT